jgi:hypothetical protein
MKPARLITVVVIAAMAACWMHVCRIRAQETKSTSANASSWGAGTARPAAPAARATNLGGGSSWTAGKGNIPLGRQAGGVWRDGTTFSAPTTKTPSSGAMSSPSATPAAYSGLISAKRLAETGPSPNKTPTAKPGSMTHASLGGGHGTLGQQRGAHTSAHGASSRLAAKRGAGGARKGQGGLQRRLKAATSGTDTASPMQENSILKPLTTLEPTDTLNSDKSPFAESSH